MRNINIEFLSHHPSANYLSPCKICKINITLLRQAGFKEPAKTIV